MKDEKGNLQIGNRAASMKSGSTQMQADIRQAEIGKLKTVDMCLRTSTWPHKT